MRKSSKFSGTFRVVEDGIEFEVHPEPEGGFTVSVPSLPGCLSYGENREKSIELIKDAIAGWLSVAREVGLVIPTYFEGYEGVTSLSSENQEPQTEEAKEVVLVLKEAGFSVKCQTKNHAFLFNDSNGHLLSVPIDIAELPLGTKKSIIHYSGLSTAYISRILGKALGIKNNIILNVIAIIFSITAILFISIPSHIYGISGVLLFPVVYLSLLFVDRPNPAKVARLSFKIRTFLVLFIIPLILFIYLWKPAGVIFLAWMVIYLLLRIKSGANKQNKAWNKKWGKIATLLEESKGYKIKYNPIIFVLTIILTIIGLLLGYQFGGSMGLWISITCAIMVWLLNPFVKSIVVYNPKDNKPNKKP